MKQRKTKLPFPVVFLFVVNEILKKYKDQKKFILFNVNQSILERRSLFFLKNNDK